MSFATVVTTAVRSVEEVAQLFSDVSSARSPFDLFLLHNWNISGRHPDDWSYCQLVTNCLHTYQLAAPTQLVKFKIIWNDGKPHEDVQMERLFLLLSKASGCLEDDGLFNQLLAEAVSQGDTGEQNEEIEIEQLISPEATEGVEMSAVEEDTERISSEVTSVSQTTIDISPPLTDGGVTTDQQQATPFLVKLVQQELNECVDVGVCRRLDIEAASGDSPVVISTMQECSLGDAADIMARGDGINWEQKRLADREHIQKTLDQFSDGCRMNSIRLTLLTSVSFDSSSLSECFPIELSAVSFDLTSGLLGRRSWLLRFPQSAIVVNGQEEMGTHNDDRSDLLPSVENLRADFETVWLELMTFVSDSALILVHTNEQYDQMTNVLNALQKGASDPEHSTCGSMYQLRQKYDLPIEWFKSSPLHGGTGEFGFLTETTDEDVPTGPNENDETVAPCESVEPNTQEENTEIEEQSANVAEASVANESAVSSIVGSPAEELSHVTTDTIGTASPTSAKELSTAATEMQTENKDDGCVQKQMSTRGLPSVGPATNTPTPRKTGFGRGRILLTPKVKQ